MARSSYGMWIGLFVMAAPIGAVMWFKWNSDGPGSNGGGEDLGVKIEAPMAAPWQPPAPAIEQRRGSRAAISGAVRDVEGSPIVGAMVCAAADSSLLSASDTRWPSCSLSGPEGRYRIEDLFGVRHRVSAGARGHLPADHVHMHAGRRRRAVDLRPGGEAHDIDLTLERGGVEIRGSVQNLRGEPIADAWIASGEEGLAGAIAWGRSGADGHYSLWVRPGTVTVLALARGHVTGRATGPSEGHAFAVYLAPESVLRGKVFRADSREPIEGAWVRAEAGGAAVLTDAAGHFHFDGLPAGIYKPRVETEDGFGMAAEQVALGLGETSWPLMLAVKPAVFVEGRIVYADGEVCDDGALTLREATSGYETRDTTEPGGLVHVRGLLPGTYVVRVACKGAIAADWYPPVTVGDKEVREQSWRVARGPEVPVPVNVGDADIATGAVRGTLRDPQGLAIAGAELSLRTTRGAQQVITGDDGGFWLERAAAGSAGVSVSVGGAPLPLQVHPRVVVRVAATTTISLVSAAPMGTITGVLRDEQGALLAGALVEARPEGQAPDSGLPGLWRVGGERPQFTDGAGRFTLPGLGAATYTVAAHRIGGGEARRGQVKPGQALTLALVSGGRVTGTVALHGGGTPGAFRIDLIEAGTGRRRSDEFIGTAGAWGFGGLSHGTYELRVEAREGAHSEVLEFASGEERSGLRLELVGATTLRGTVLDLEGAPVPGLEVATSSVRGDESDSQSITDVAGRFELPRLPVGLVSVTVGPPNGQASPFGAVRIAVDVQPERPVITLAPIRVARRRIALGGPRGDLGFTMIAGEAGADPLLAALKVETVRFGGPAASGGLQPLDEIVAVDGQDVRGANRSLYATLTEVPAGTVLRLGLARGVTVRIVASKRR